MATPKAQAPKAPASVQGGGDKHQLKHHNSVFQQKQKKWGLLVTSELSDALEQCRKKVERIARECRMQNRKFRDIEFDLENDRERCLHGVNTPDSERFNPSDVQRATQIFENPQFFVDGADCNDIVQGAIGDCWFLSAIATMATCKGLIEKFCVARDEVIGVYGFIFYRDAAWKVVIIDDLLYTSIPKFEELSFSEQALYHHDKERYNKTARRGGKSLYFAKSGTAGETWVPLLEKAYAKFHGDYYSLNGGSACEAIEDLTGGVSTFMLTKDILDTDRFWREELLNANQDRVFSCAYDVLDSSRSGDDFATVNGLIGSHAYSVLKAVECKGRRFVIVRNPWGKTEWNGPWSDGAKEWNAEWLAQLDNIGHKFGDDGQFLMEYKDFLASWERVDRTLLFDQNWSMSSQWLEVKARPMPSAWGYGDVSFTFTLPAASPAIIVLSQIDERFFEDISSRWTWTFDFTLFKRGEEEPIATTPHARFWRRSVNLEVKLDAGDYVVHVRLDRLEVRPKSYIEENVDNWNKRKLSRVMTEKAISQSIASNFDPSTQSISIATTLESLGPHDLSELNAQQESESDWEDESDEEINPEDVVSGQVTIETVQASHHANTNNDTLTEIKKNIRPTFNRLKEMSMKKIETLTKDLKKEEPAAAPPPETDGEDGEDEDGEGEDGEEDGPPVSEMGMMMGGPPEPPLHEIIAGEDNSIFLGLRVYSHKKSPAVVGGQLRQPLVPS